jgi:hypothetical protein
MLRVRLVRFCSRITDSTVINPRLFDDILGTARESLPATINEIHGLPIENRIFPPLPP